MQNKSFDIRKATTALAAFLGGRGRATRWFYLLLLMAAWGVTRWPWLECDGGVSSLCEYGYFATDEGYYLGGGKEKFCNGIFVDLLRGEACTFGFSPLTHLLCWFSYLVFGLKPWAERVPFFLINMAAHAALFMLLARRARAWAAAAMCACVMFTPWIVMYERTASNDVLIGSLFILSYAAACSRKAAGALAAGALCALIAWVKPSAYVLLPILLCGVWSARKTRFRALDFGLFGGAFLLVAGLKKILIPILLRPDVAFNGVDAARLIRSTTSHHQLPDLANIERVLAGISSFPRSPTATLLSVWAVLLTVLPLTMLAWCVCGRRRIVWSRSMILYLTVAAYTFGVAIIGIFYAHYLIPVAYFSPLLWLEMRKDLRDAAPKTPAMALLPLLLAALAAGLFATGSGFATSELQAIQDFATNSSNLPKKVLWIFTWRPMLSCGAAAGLFGIFGLALRAFRERRPRAVPKLLLQSAALLLCLALALSVGFAQQPMAILAPYVPHLRPLSGAMMLNMRVCLIGGTALVLAIWLFPRQLRRGHRFMLAPLALLLGAAIFCPAWRGGFSELAHRNFLYRDAAQTLLAQLPPNALVLGERATQMFLGTPMNSSSTFLSNSNLLPIVEKMAAQHPDTPLFALLDPEQSYNWRHLENNKDKVRYRIINKVTLPSFARSEPVDVLVAEIIPVKKPNP